MKKYRVAAVLAVLQVATAFAGPNLKSALRAIENGSDVTSLSREQLDFIQNFKQIREAGGFKTRFNYFTHAEDNQVIYQTLSKDSQSHDLKNIRQLKDGSIVELNFKVREGSGELGGNRLYGGLQIKNSVIQKYDTYKNPIDPSNGELYQVTRSYKTGDEIADNVQVMYTLESGTTAYKDGFKSTVSRVKDGRGVKFTYVSKDGNWERTIDTGNHGNVVGQLLTRTLDRMKNENLMMTIYYQQNANTINEIKYRVIRGKTHDGKSLVSIERASPARALSRQEMNEFIPEFNSTSQATPDKPVIQGLDFRSSTATGD